MWKKFFDALLPNRKYYDRLQRKPDTIYQIVHATITKKKKPLHIFADLAVHEASRTKRVITILSRLGLSISYYEMKWTDTRLAKRTIMKAGNFWVPIDETIESGTIFQGAAMDNFDHDENTMSGKNGSHETMLMLFQNNDVDKPPQDIIHNVPENLKTTEDERTLQYILPCQLINKGRNVGKRGEIEDSKFYNTICTVISSSQQFLQFETECNYKICFYSYHTSSSNQVWCNIYMYEEFPGCFSTKRFGVWSPMMRWRRLSNS